MRLRDVSEGELLARVFPVYAGARPAAWGSVPVGPGDDAAVVGTPGGSVVATTDSMVRGRDWRDDWSSGARRRRQGRRAEPRRRRRDGRGADRPARRRSSPTPSSRWSGRSTWPAASRRSPSRRGRRSSAATCRRRRPGSSSSRSPPWATCAGRAPVLRSGARPGDVVAVCGSLGLSGGGLALYERGEPDPDRVLAAECRRAAGTVEALGERPLAVRALMRHHRAPVPPVAGPGRGPRPPGRTPLDRRLRRARHRPRPGRRRQRGAGRPRRGGAARALRRRPADLALGGPRRCTRCSPGARSTRWSASSPTRRRCPRARSPDGLDEPWPVVGRVLPEAATARGSPSTARCPTRAAGTTSPADRHPPTVRGAA